MSHPFIPSTPASHLITPTTITPSSLSYEFTPAPWDTELEARNPSPYWHNQIRKDVEFEAIAESIKKTKARPNTWHTPNPPASISPNNVLDHPEEVLRQMFRQKRPFLPTARPSPPPPKEDRVLAVPTVKRKDDGSGYVVRWTEDCPEAHRRARITRKTGMVPLPKPAPSSPLPSQSVSADQSSPAGLRDAQAHHSPTPRKTRGPAFDSPGLTSYLEVDDARSYPSFETTLGPATLYHTHFNLVEARVALDSQYSVGYSYPDTPPPPPHRSQARQIKTKPKELASAAEVKTHGGLRVSTRRTSTSTSTPAANPPTCTHRGGRSSSHVQFFQTLTPAQAPSRHLTSLFDPDSDRDTLEDEDKEEHEGEDKFEEQKSNSANKESEDEDWERLSTTSSTNSDIYDKISLASVSGDEADDEKEPPGTHRRRAVLFAYHIARLEATGRFMSNRTWNKKKEMEKAKAKA